MYVSRAASDQGMTEASELTTSLTAVAAQVALTLPNSRTSESEADVLGIEIAARAVGNSSTRGDLVLDLFLGSGTTLIAAEQLGRKCFGIEIEPRYCDVIVKRWETLTGQKATVEATVERWTEDRVAERLWEKDHTLWVDADQPEIADRLGLPDLPGSQDRYDRELPEQT